MGLEIVLGHNAVADNLGPHVGVDVLALLAHHHLLQDRLGPDGVAHPHAGGDDLGEGAGVDHHALGIQGLDGGHVLPGKAQIAVGVVLQDDDVVLPAQLIDFLALLQAHGDAGGVLEVGDGVQVLHVFLGVQGLLQLLGVDAVFLHGDAHQLGPVGAEGVQRADEAGGLAQDGVPLVEQSLGEEVHHLLGAAGDEDVVVLGAHMVLLGHVAHQVLAQGGVALCDAVLKGVDGGVLQQLLGNLPHRLVGEGVRGGVARGQGDDAGVGGVFQNLPDGGGLKALHTF